MTSIEQLLRKILEQEKIESLIHVGGHRGEEVDFYKSYGLSRVIYFEPIKQFYLEIIDNINSKNLSNFEAFNIALGSENKSEEIYVADGDSSGSSSILEPRPSDITFSKKEMIEILLEYGANEHIENELGLTPWQMHYDYYEGK